MPTIRCAAAPTQSRRPSATRNHVQDGVNYSGKCLICHSDDPVDGERARAKICAEFPKADVHLLKIGTIIGVHCGPGTVAVFWGDQRTHEDPK
ncbi:MAG: DegV family protein [Christensenellales bacterium]